MEPAPPVPGLLPGWTVQLLTGAQAMEQEPELFEDHAGVEFYFNELGAHGNARWVDYWPKLVLLVRDPTGGVAVASNASVWHMESLGAPIPDEALS